MWDRYERDTGRKRLAFLQADGQRLCTAEIEGRVLGGDEGHAFEELEDLFTHVFLDIDEDPIAFCHGKANVR